MRPSPCGPSGCGAGRRQARGSPSGAAEGFTLVEVLVALTLMGFLAAILMGGLRFGIRAWDTGEERSEALIETQAIQSVLRRTFQQAVPVMEPGEEVLAFDGRSEALEFVAPLPSSLGPGGLHRIRIAAIRDRDGTSLVFWRLPFHPDLDRRDIDAEPPLLLLGGVRELRFSYFGADQPAVAPRWMESWQERSRLPDLIQVGADFAEGDPRRWQDLVVAPAVGIESACVREPALRRCRERLARR